MNHPFLSYIRICLFLLFGSTLNSLATECATPPKWQIHVSNSAINFTVKLQPFFTVPGRFGMFSGTISFDPQKPDTCTFEAKIKASSIDTNDIERDHHLRSIDFFNTTKFPYISFSSTQSEKIDDSHYQITGLLTICGQAKEVQLNATYLGLVINEGKSRVIGWEAETEIARSEWGIDYGPNMVSDTVMIKIHAQAVEIKE